MNLEYMKVSLFEIIYNKKILFHYIQIFVNAPGYKHCIALLLVLITYIALIWIKASAKRLNVNQIERD